MFINTTSLKISTGSVFSILIIKKKQNFLLEMRIIAKITHLLSIATPSDLQAALQIWVKNKGHNLKLSYFWNKNNKIT